MSRSRCIMINCKMMELHTEYMADAGFSPRLIVNLRTKLGEEYEVVPEYTPESGDMSEVYDLAILEDGHLKMLFELEVGDSFKQAKDGLRKYYGENAAVSDLVMAACNREKIVVFDAENELLSEVYEERAPRKIAEEISNFLSRGGEHE